MKLLVFVIAFVVGTSALRSRILSPSYDTASVDHYQEVTTSGIPRVTSERLGVIMRDRYVRGPIGVVVDTEPTSLAQSKRLWEATLNQVNDAGVELLLMPYGTSGMGGVIRTKGAARFRQVLDSLEATPVPPHTDAGSFGGVAFYSVLRATEQVLYDGAVVLMTGRSAVDESLAQLAATTLIQKRCKLHVVWYGNVSESGSPGYELLYREVAQSTGGDFIIANMSVDERAEEFETPTTQRPNRDTLATSSTNVEEVTLAVRHEVSGDVEIPLHVDSTVHALHITIKGSVSSAHLRQPTGVTIDLLSETALRRWASDSARLSTGTSDGVDVRLDTSAATPGTWMLTTSGEAKYDVTVKAVSKLSFTASVQSNDETQSGVADPGHGLLRLTMTGVGDVEHVSLLDAHGAELHQLTYQRRDDIAEDPDNEVTTDLQLPGNFTLPNTVYVRLTGHDPSGAEFSRVEPVTLERQQLAPNVPTLGGQQLAGVTVEMSANTTLNILPNYWGQLIFEVTNNRNVPVLYQFQARDDRGYVRSLYPRQANIGPHLTYNVAVGVIAPSDTSYGSTNNVELIVQSQFESSRKIAEVTVGDRVQDYERPLMWHWIRTNCQNYVAPNVCHTRIWSVEFRIEDRQSGLLRVISQPPGIRFTSEFAAGTKNQVTAYYSATCCENRVAITAIDTAGNYLKYEVNGDDTYWGLDKAGIAAVSLGAILFVALIILIVLIICLCRGRTKKSHDLPVHPRSRH